jgi:tRNA (guanine-N7-)-methyltransferase
MRLRNIRGAKETIDAFKYSFNSGVEFKGNWDKEFGNDKPIHIEIGMGKGNFVIGMAKQNPHINYIGIERYDSVLVRAVEKLELEDVTNVRLLKFDATDLTDVFESGEIDQIYLNFSDPWPKTRHAKRRLTSPLFLDRYEQVIKPEGEIHFKTDNQGLFEYSLESMCEYGMLLKNISLNLHKSDFEGNVMTEYEAKFHGLGQRIYRLEAKYRRQK